ncbi:MAG: tRNA-dihydrouridine synthase family protein [Phycisphaerae bacterium]|nr:tRNA-dihydrouridine synthase family protein [Phycisphaerae bacterium]
MQIKNPKLCNDLFLAPMAGFTDPAFRMLCKKQGVALTFTEMVSVNALARNNKATLKLLDSFADEKPIGVQLFGSKPEHFIKAIENLEIYEKENNKRFDVIDINFGCPASKIIKQGAGSALLQRPEKIKQIVETVVSVAQRPVFCKIRSGISKNKINAPEIAKICENAGASLVTIHARTQKQGYSGKADWSVIEQVKDNVNIPVCANGDICSYKDYVKIREQTNADYFMIGRAALSNVFIFREILQKNKLKTSKEMKINTLLDYVELAEECNIHFNNIKVHAQHFLKGLANSTKIRNKLSRIKGLNGLLKIVKEVQ